MWVCAADILISAQFGFTPKQDLKPRFRYK